MTTKPTWDEVGPELLADLKEIYAHTGWRTDRTVELIARAEQVGKD